MSLSGWLASLPGATHTAPPLSPPVSALLSFLKTVYLLLSLSSTTGGFSARKLSIANLKKSVSLAAHEACFLPPFAPIVFLLCCISPEKKRDKVVRLSRRLCNYLLGYSFIDVHLLGFVYGVCACASVFSIDRAAAPRQCWHDTDERGLWLAGNRSSSPEDWTPDPQDGGDKVRASELVNF